MFPRLLNLPKSNSYFLFGPRQVGKTSLVTSSLKAERVLKYDLLDSKEYFRLIARPALFAEELMKVKGSIDFVVIDEVQRVPALLDEVHRFIEMPNPPVFVLTGSSARKLKRSGTNMLGGRAWTLRLHPLTYREMAADFDLMRVLELGSLPKIATINDDDAKQTLRSYVETYLKEEIEAEALVRATGVFVRFLHLASHESGAILNYSTLSRDTGTSAKTIKEYYKILEDTLIGRFLPAFSRSARKRLVAHPKFYLFDTGVQRALTKKLTVPLQHATSEYGLLFEHFIINEVFRLNDYLQKDHEFSYYRTEHGAEVDLIIETPAGECFAVEIKSTENPSLSDVRSGLKSFKEVVPHARLICVCNALRMREADGIEIWPWQQFFDAIY